MSYILYFVMLKISEYPKQNLHCTHTASIFYCFCYNSTDKNVCACWFGWCSSYCYSKSQGLFLCKYCLLTHSLLSTKLLLSFDTFSAATIITTLLYLNHKKGAYLQQTGLHFCVICFWSSGPRRASHHQWLSSVWVFFAVVTASLLFPTTT